jgi:hypothetical protein
MIYLVYKKWILATSMIKNLASAGCNIGEGIKL